MSDVEQIFGAFYRLIDSTFKLQAIRELEEGIASVSAKRCGNCDNWMKSTCIPEKQKGQFKHINSPGCSEFLVDPVSQKLLKDREAKLSELVIQLKQEGLL